MVDRGQGTNSGDRADERVTIAETAALLGVHPNTVRNRIKAGIYEAEKVFTENGQTWMIPRNSLLNNTLPKGSQQPSSQRSPVGEVQSMELVQDLLRPFVEDLGRVREELGAERVRREQAEQERDRLAAELEDLRRESPEATSGGEDKGGVGAPEPQAGGLTSGLLARLSPRDKLPLWQYVLAVGLSAVLYVLGTLFGFMEGAQPALKGFFLQVTPVAFGAWIGLSKREVSLSLAIANVVAVSLSAATLIVGGVFGNTPLEELFSPVTIFDLLSVIVFSALFFLSGMLLGNYVLRARTRTTPVRYAQPEFEEPAESQPKETTTHPDSAPSRDDRSSRANLVIGILSGIIGAVGSIIAAYIQRGS